jgi:endonuclease/exonuclease/phosphatase family metal-dependent hydrolase
MTLVTATVDRLAVPLPGQRAAWRAGPSDDAAFRAAFAAATCLHAVEVVPPPAPAPPLDRPARVAFWNAERLKYPEPSVALLRGLVADALLLAEVDVGMARSGNRHTIGALAAALAAGYAFGVEFVELDLGDARERRRHAGEVNAAGLHGGGIVSGHPLAQAALIRLESSGRWFDDTFDERRVGGRIAAAAGIEVMGRPVLLVAAHYESHTGPADRAAQTEVLLQAVDALAPGWPVLIGGDVNTSTVERAADRHDRAALLAHDPDRLVDPVRYEPMFDVLARAGYGWADCNVPKAPTQRARPDGTPAPPFGKIDWFFARGLACRAPAVVPAVDAAGRAISDHEVLVVEIAPAGA